MFLKTSVKTRFASLSAYEWPLLLAEFFTKFETTDWQFWRSTEKPLLGSQKRLAIQDAVNFDFIHNIRYSQI